MVVVKGARERVAWENVRTQYFLEGSYNLLGGLDLFVGLLCTGG